jgi:hypothetical protein
MPLCIECNKRNGHEILGGSCTRCARDNRLFTLREIADQLELAWSDYCDIIYRVEVFEGERVPPAVSNDRALGHDVQGEPEMGLSSGASRPRFSTPMKQPKVRSATQDDEEMTDE